MSSFVVDKSLGELLSTVRQAIIDDQKSKGIRSSGKSAESLRDVITSKDNKLTGEVLGEHYFYQQKKGRRPGKFPPISSILEWIREKGIKPNDDISEKSLAFLIARKIANEGTDIFRGKRPGLNIDDKVKEALRIFREKVSKAGREVIIKNLKG